MRKKLTTYLDEETIRKLKIMAINSNSSVSDILNEITDEHIRMNWSDEVKVFKSYEDLLKAIVLPNDEFKSYADEKLNDFLAYDDSHVDAIEPINSFNLQYDDKIFNVGVTSVYNGENCKYTYWLIK